jgi:hypothetical protein
VFSPYERTQLIKLLQRQFEGQEGQVKYPQNGEQLTVFLLGAGMWGLPITFVLLGLGLEGGEFGFWWLTLSVTAMITYIEVASRRSNTEHLAELNGLDDVALAFRARQHLDLTDHQQLYRAAERVVADWRKPTP